MDAFTRLLSRLIPLPVVHGIRDSGLFRLISDSLTTILAAVYGILDPRLLIAFIKLSYHSQSYKYGSRSIEYLQKIDLEKARENSQIAEEKIMLFVHGGAWGSGAPWMYKLTAHGLATLFEVQSVIIVGYPVYPDANIQQQSDAIVAAVDYIKSNSRMMNISKEASFVLAGHSSGANISLLACMCTARQRRKLVDTFLGLSGVYDLVKHHDFEKNRGVHEISPMTAAAGGYESLSLSSPTLTLRDSIGSEESVLYKDFLPRTIMLHCKNDSTVPHESTSELEDVLAGMNIPTYCQYYDGSHVDPVLHLMSRSARLQSSEQNTLTHIAARTSWKQHCSNLADDTSP